MKPEMIRRGEMLNAEDILDILAIDLIGIIPEDESVIVASNQGSPIVFDSRSRAGKAFHQIAQRLLGEDVPFETLESKDGFFGKIARLVRQGGAS